MNTERLLRIAEIVEAVPPEKFDMGEWYLSCKTVGCAIGWAAQAPDIAALGLTVSRHGPEYAGLTDFEAVAAFIGEDSFEAYVANSLFAPFSYKDSFTRSGTPTPKYVAKCVRYVANGGLLKTQYWEDTVTAD